MSPGLNDLLRDVSRSFYLTLRILPGAIRGPIGLAYLLARATDTIADTGAVSVDQRLATLQQLRTRILGETHEPFAIKDLGEKQSTESERILLERVDEALMLLFQFTPFDRQQIQRVLEIITSGQELDLRRFGQVSAGQVAALPSDADLDDYTYRVAGCVGEFWTRICHQHLSPAPRVPLQSLIERGVCFGQGLQLVNILRDLPADLRNGRCYLPESSLRKAGLKPHDLLNPASEQQLRPVYDAWLARARDHLGAAWSYVLDLPRSWVRTRIACAFPVLIGVKTLNRLQAGHVLNPDTRIKVSRAEVKRIVRATVFFYPVNSLWKKLPSRMT